MEKLNKNISKSNYTLFIIILLFTIISTIFVFMLYEAYKVNKRQISAISDRVNVITTTDISEYVNENEYIFLYLNASKDTVRDYEEEMLLSARENDISITFLDMDNILDRKSFYKKINAKYAGEIKLRKYPSLILIKDAKIVGIVEEKNEKLNIKDINNLFSIKDKEELYD